MVKLDQPEFANTTDCAWLVPTGTFPKLILEGLTVSVLVPQDALAVKVKTTRKVKSKQNREGILIRLKPNFFTVRPLGPRSNLELRGGGFEAAASRSESHKADLLYGLQFTHCVDRSRTRIGHER